MSEFDYDIYLKDPDRVRGFTKGSSHGRTPMPRSQRAKQFAPFDALTGLHARLYRAIEEHKKDSESNAMHYEEAEE